MIENIAKGCPFARINEKGEAYCRPLEEPCTNCVSADEGIGEGTKIGRVLKKHQEMAKNGQFVDYTKD